MSRSSFLYALWCLGVLGLYLTAAAQGYSPFADGGRTAGAARAYGPTHK
ncbi:MAG: hypothetical protein H2050_11310 [Sphingobium sp.]|jgi:hypothetical protein|nr:MULTISPECIES: hypothetical protein [Sphingobium]MBU0657445.1 hypothetical protein [Alphaproteobacteria bacterium]MBA4755408.1 hypothetical protein [Sphingobium sp.]MBU0867382.1 hypothetical protein [Alphaproteobacteria bacterium]MBU1259496.1 hypothetical protein [Alphaproteobacteria bacterium]MBU1463871.1 hypothetical protein [Alphaproteobacteria bacterium]|tara:strand:+ start:697 stop:843 length:147 start_codon:yes stop_codon:yes gene_type:complete